MEHDSSDWDGPFLVIIMFTMGFTENCPDSVFNYSTVFRSGTISVMVWYILAYFLMNLYTSNLRAYIIGRF